MFLLNMWMDGIIFSLVMAIMGIFIVGFVDAVFNDPRDLRVWNIILFPYWIGYGLGTVAAIKVGSSK